MTQRDDALLAPAAVRRVERRAQQVWQVCGGVAVVLVAVTALAFGPSWPAAALLLCLCALVAGAWAWMRTARTLRAAGDRASRATAGKQSTGKRWARAVRHGTYAEIDPEEAPDMVGWAHAAAVRARLVPYGVGGLWLGLALVQAVNLGVNAPPFADGPLARVLVVLVITGLFATAWWLHRRERLRLEAFLDGLDPPGPTADRP